MWHLTGLGRQAVSGPASTEPAVCGEAQAPLAVEVWLPRRGNRGSIGEEWECAVVGGGGTALSAALVLGRALRRAV
jgi:hypothetical protein